MTVGEFNTIRRPFYFDMDTMLVKFPDARHANMSHAEWFADYGLPWAHMVRGYYWKHNGEEFVMIYWNDFEIPNVTAIIFCYIFEHFTNIKWIGIGCEKGKLGEIWQPKLKVFRSNFN